jgi:hypothetical protein
MNFGLVGDYDVMFDIDDLAEDLRESLAELARAAGVELSPVSGAQARETVSQI